jgi:hypothetical protein
MVRVRGTVYVLPSVLMRHDTDLMPRAEDPYIYMDPIKPAQNIFEFTDSQENKMQTLELRHKML